MNNDQKAKELLLSSYGVSVNRILEAMRGQLTIKNSRIPDNPPTGTGEIIGLCGQSGRHPYFRIPAAALKSALDRILRAGQNRRVGGDQVDNAIEDVAAACRELANRPTLMRVLVV